MYVSIDGITEAEFDCENYNPGINSYKIATVVLFMSIFAPFWIAYSALLKIALMQDRYEPTFVKSKGCLQKFFLMLFLTFLGTILLIVSKVLLAVGEVLALLTYLTFSRRRVAKVKRVFETAASYVLIDIDRHTFDGV